MNTFVETGTHVTQGASTSTTPLPGAKPVHQSWDKTATSLGDPYFAVPTALQDPESLSISIGRPVKR